MPLLVAAEKGPKQQLKFMEMANKLHNMLMLQTLLNISTCTYFKIFL